MGGQPAPAQPGSPAIIIVTGLSGAGKTEAVKALEDRGFFCVDNLPPALIPTFAQLCLQSGHIHRVALVSDARGGEFFDQFFEAVAELERREMRHRILFLEASNEALVRRFKETRRRHPLASEGSVLEGIQLERRRLAPLRERADVILETSNLTVRQLREQVVRQAEALAGGRGLSVTVVSFGYSRGIPMDADMIFDVRFLPNPHYVPYLRPLTGNDRRVSEYVFQWPISQQFVERLLAFIDFLLPHFVSEGKSHLLLGIGCTGGRHRSVAVANRLVEHLRKAGYEAAVEHRDVGDQSEDEGQSPGGLTAAGRAPAGPSGSSGSSGLEGG